MVIERLASDGRGIFAPSSWHRTAFKGLVSSCLYSPGGIEQLSVVGLECAGVFLGIQRVFNDFAESCQLNPEANVSRTALVDVSLVALENSLQSCQLLASTDGPGNVHGNA